MTCYVGSNGKCKCESRIGSHDEFWKGIIGKFGIGEMNENGENFAERVQ